MLNVVFLLGLFLSFQNHAIAAITEAVEVYVGDEHSCALLEDGSFWCWGNNSEGQLGLGDLVTRTHPQKINLKDKVVTASVRGENTCVILETDQSLWCWGSNKSKQLLLSTELYVDKPTEILRGQKFTDVEIGTNDNSRETTIMAVEGGKLLCWGYDCPIGKYDRDTYQPVYADKTDCLPGRTCQYEDIKSIGFHISVIYSTLLITYTDHYFASTNGDPHGTTINSSCYRCGTIDLVLAKALACYTKGTDLYCYPSDISPVKTFNGIIPHSFSDSIHSIAFSFKSITEGYVGLADGTLWQWEWQQRFVNTTYEFSFMAVSQVKLNHKVKSVKSGSNSVCLISDKDGEDRGGRVKCWGSNTYGQLGDGTTTSSKLTTAKWIYF